MHVFTNTTNAKNYLHAWKGGKMVRCNVGKSPDFQLQWKQDFRMNGFNFEKLVNEVRHALEKQDTHDMRKAIRVEKRVAIAIWRLSTGNSFRSVAKTFAIGKSTAVKVTREFCKEF